MRKFFLLALFVLSLFVSELACAQGLRHVGPFILGATQGALLANPTFCRNLENVRCVDVNNIAGWSPSNGDIGAWINSAIADLGCSNGGYVFVAAGTATFSTTINANDCHGIKIIGSAGPGGGNGNQLTYTGTGSILTAARSFGVQFSNFYIQWNNPAIAGPLIELSDGSTGATAAEISHNVFFAVSPGANVPILVDLDHTINSLVEFNGLNNYVVGIRGMANSTSFSNANSLRHNTFSSGSGDAVTAHIRNPGSGIEVLSNTFEMGTAAGTPAIVQCTFTNAAMETMDFGGNWAGDAGAGTWTWFTGCFFHGWNIHGNYFQGNGNGTGVTFISIPQLSACNCISGGLAVTGNSFVNFGPLLVANNNLNELTWLGNNLFQTGALFDFPAISQISQTPGNSSQNGILLSGPVGMTANGSGSGGLVFSNWAGTQVASIDLSGNAHFNGNLTVSGVKAFKIDHPLDPAHKYLLHSVVESPDVKNMYDGIVTLDEHGEAEVKLPDWFQALNQDFRYQLTCIGGSSPVYVAQEIQDNRFRVAGGRPGLKVSWQVTGIRHDPSAQANHFAVEEEKPTKDSNHQSPDFENVKPKPSKGKSSEK